MTFVPVSRIHEVLANAVRSAPPVMVDAGVPVGAALANNDGHLAAHEA
jgi:hypothetical protein